MSGPYLQLDRLLRLALEEDLPNGDVTTDSIVGTDRRGVGHLVAREATILAGSESARRVFEMVDATLEVDFSRVDGDELSAGERFARVSGSLRSLFRGERTALNLLQRLCGIAQHTRRFVAAIGEHDVTVVDTRKTTPGMRALEKAAVRAGGGRSHRFCLSDGVLIKSNHVEVAGSVRQAVAAARAAAPHTLRIEVEVRDRAELSEAIEAGADICMLDNMSRTEVVESVEFAAGRCILEASGGINLDTVAAMAATGVDLLSVGALTHSAPSSDLAFEIKSVA